VIEFALYQGIANLEGSACGYSPEFENGFERLWCGVLEFASGIGVRDLDSDVTGKLQNGFLDGWINEALDLRMDWSSLLVRGVS
jgi:hypothetical protein